MQRSPSDSDTDATSGSVCPSMPPRQMLFTPLTRSNATMGLMLILSLSLVNCGDKDAGDSTGNRGKGPGNRRAQNVAAIPVRAVAAERGDISTYLMQTTTIEPERQVDIVSKVSGQVVALTAEEGLHVKKHDLLAQLDEAELRINFMRAQVTLETDKSVYERSKDMLDRAFIATEDFEAARLQYESAKAAHEAARLQLDYTSIRAPFDGVVVVRNIELGQRVNVNEPLFVIGDFTPLRAKTYVPEKDIGRIFVGMKARIVVEAQPGEDFSGIVRRISPVIDPNSGTSKVTIDIDNHRGKLKPGMFASVYITTETHENTLIIPKKALVLESDMDQIYIYRDGKAHKVHLKLGFTSGEYAEVLSGIKEGDLVVTAGQDGLREGLPIRIPGMEPAQTQRAEGTEKAPPRRDKMRKRK
ncbi:MAG: efflux RND transporter periplasmic adaptor subunit [Desulfobacterales bacterium]